MATVGKGKGKGKGKATAAVIGSPGTPTDKDPNPAPVPITACPPYLPHTLHHVPADIRDRAARVALHSLAFTLNLTDHDDFAAQSLVRRVPELAESFLRFRTKQDRSQVTRALDAAVLAWFRRLAVAVAGTMPLGGPVAHLIHDVSVLAVLDFCKWYGHAPSVAKPVIDVLFTAHGEYLHDLDDVLRTITALVSRALQGDEDEDQVVVLARSVVDGLGALARLVAMYPHAAEIMDAALVLSVAALHDAVPAARPLHVHNVAVDFVVAVIRAKYLDGESIAVGPLVQMLEELLDSAQARATAGVTLLVVELAKDEGLVGDLDRVAKSEPSLSSVMTRLKSFQPPLAAATPPAATTPPAYETAAVQDIELSLKVSQVQDLFPDMSSTHITSLLARFSNSTEDLIDALLTDESLRVPPPPEAPEPAPTAPAGPAPEDARLQASIRARLEAMDELRTAQRVQSSKAANNMPEVDKAKILALAAAMAADEYDDEYDDTYDSVDAPVADGDESSEVSLRPVRNVVRGGGGGGVADPAHPHEEVLYSAFTTNPAVLERAGKKDPARATLRSKTGLTDQQIEGWAVMLKRDPRRLRQLEARYSAFHGNRAPTGPTDGAAAAPESGPRTQEPNGRDASPARRGGHSSGPRGGGRGGRGGGRGGAHSGATDGAGAGRGGARGDGRGGGRGGAAAGDGAGRGGGRGRGGSSRNMRREGHFKKMAQNNALA
ncbi:hypothetical protein GGF31_000281 [Allomyces arbusculus]|nr:hypothetical protein GGF31_000281 [Allomyces arbusculus]